jgi:indolepyruvate decarboxylase
MSTVAQYLTKRLAQLGVSHIFLVPGNYLAEFIAAAESTFQFICCNNEMEAAHAADAAGRLKGVGVCAVTEGVGLGSSYNAMEGARVEMVPVITISGGAKTTAVSEMKNRGITYSHGIDPTRNDVRTASAVAEDSAEITAGKDAPAIIDRVLRSCISKSLPVFLQVREDVWLQECAEPVGDLGEPDVATLSDGNVDAAVQAVVSALKGATNSLFWAGMELMRRAGMQDQFAELLRLTGRPYVTTIVAKCVLDETDPKTAQQYAGLYDGVFADDDVAAAVHAADLIISLGALRVEDDQLVTDEKWGQTIDVRGDVVRVGWSYYHNVPFTSFVNGLVETLAASQNGAGAVSVVAVPSSKAARPLTEPRGSEKPITWDSFFDILADHLITPDTQVLADTSVLMLPAAQRLKLRRNRFLTQACWFSIGYTMGGTIGAAASLPASDKVVCIVGDGGFQQQPQAIGTLVMIKRPAVVFVMDNGFYAIEQLLIEPTFFLDLAQPGLFYNKRPRWDYAQLAQSFGALGRNCTTESELYEALAMASQLVETPMLIAVSLDPRDLPSEVKRFLPKRPAAVGHVSLKRMR